MWNRNCLILLALCIISFTIKIIVTPFDIELEGDNKLYYYYGAELAYHNKPPEDTQLKNVGFSYLLSLIFRLLPPDQNLLYNTQRLITVLAILLTPGVIAYFDAYDTRYFMPAYPILTLISLYGIKQLTTITNKVHTLLK